jgi:hypothetical protein
MGTNHGYHGTQGGMKMAEFTPFDKKLTPKWLKLRNYLTDNSTWSDTVVDKFLTKD